MNSGVFALVPFLISISLVGRWLSGRSKPRHGRETAGLKTRHYRGLRQGRAEFAGGEGVEGAEASSEFGGGQAALAIEPAEKIIGRLFSFLGVAFHAARDQVAVGIAPRPRPRHDGVQAGGRPLIPKNAFGWPILAGLFLARVGFFLLSLV